MGSRENPNRRDSSVVTTQLSQETLDENEVEEEFSINFESVYQTLVSEMYQSPRAGVREAVTNAISAVRRAIKYHDLDEGDGLVEVTVDGRSDTLVVQDNGDGVDSRTRELISDIGRGASYADSDLIGMFGMGFLAMFKLSGEEGGIIMHTRPRDSEEGAVSGIWAGGQGFSDYSDKMECNIEGYGTRFEIPLRKPASEYEFDEWMDSLFEKSRCPLLYTRYDDSGNKAVEEEYYSSSLDEEYDEGRPYIKVKNDYFVAYCVEERATNRSGRHRRYVSDETYCLDVPINRNFDGYFEGLPYSVVDVRLFDEKGTIYQSEVGNEGLIPAGSRYDDLPESLKHKFIREAAPDDNCLPKPSSSREKLQKKDEFWEHLNSLLREEWYRSFARLLEDSDSSKDVLSLPEKDIQMLADTFSKLHSGGEISGECWEGVKRRAEEQLGRSLRVEDEVMKTVNALAIDEVSVLERDSEKVSKRNMTSKEVYDIHSDTDGSVYMGVSMNIEKASVIWEDSDDNVVVSIPQSSSYDLLEEALGWDYLKRVSKSTIDDFDVSDSTVEEWTKDSTPSSSKEIVVHFGRKKTGRKSMTPSDIKDSAQGDYDFIAFPPGVEENLSDNYQFANNRVGMFNCSKSVYETLKSEESVRTIHEHEEYLRSIPVRVGSGSATVGELLDGYDSVGVQRVRAECYDGLMPDFWDRIQRFGQEEFNCDIYVLLPTKTESDGRFSYLLRNADKVVSEGYTTSKGVKLYAFCKLYEWRGSETYNTIVRKRRRFPTGILTIIDNLHIQLKNTESEVPPAEI